MTLYSVDTSAWRRATEPAVVDRWRGALESDVLGICDQVRLEILYSAQSPTDYEELAEELKGLKPIPITGESYQRALEVQAGLARLGGLHHRSVKIADLLIAASAELSDAVVWHYDEDYDRIAHITGQPTEWIVPRGSI